MCIRDSLREVLDGQLQGIILDQGQAQAKDEGNQQGFHNTHDGRHLDGEQAAQSSLFCILGIRHEHVSMHQAGEQGHIHDKRQRTGDDGGQVGNAGGSGQGLACAGTQIRDAGRCV